MSHLNNKCRLQEYCQKNQLSFPLYVSIPLGSKFKAYVTIGTHQFAESNPKSTKKEAEQEAAQNALEQILTVKTIINTNTNLITNPITNTNTNLITNTNTNLKNYPSYSPSQHNNTLSPQINSPAQSLPLNSPKYPLSQLNPKAQPFNQQYSSHPYQQPPYQQQKVLTKKSNPNSINTYTTRTNPNNINTNTTRTNTNTNYINTNTNTNTNTNYINTNTNTNTNTTRTNTNTNYINTNTNTNTNTTRTNTNTNYINTNTTYTNTKSSQQQQALCCPTTSVQPSPTTSVYMTKIHEYCQKNYLDKPIYTHTQCIHGFKATLNFGGFPTTTTEHAFPKKNEASHLAAEIAYNQHLLPKLEEERKTKIRRQNEARAAKEEERKKQLEINIRRENEARAYLEEKNSSKEIRLEILKKEVEHQLIVKELWINICRRLSFKNLVSLGSTCVFLYQVTSDDMFWQETCKKFCYYEKQNPTWKMTALEQAPNAKAFANTSQRRCQSCDRVKLDWNFENCNVCDESHCSSCVESHYGY